MSNKILHERYIDALLNGGDILEVKTALDESFELWRRQLDRQHQMAKVLEDALAGPEDTPARIAVIQFLTALKGGAEE